MGMPFDDRVTKTDQELLTMITGMARDNPIAVAVERVLQALSGQRQV